ncbi:NUMOD3 domain-containing DNA-binding protein [Hymenobacter sp. M29]|uniref:NUMOD3 domain-containing DNA-binding protein n=1 Tax=Hymenobacter mellowenesis TaxID=3063995 RepID=A0ABT9AGN7_9BACT|nr:NUMOD3 domain-containing DNA-binding protein [Hymenobacter sp. M29]MDO7849001.1 NUMOD3 domain-containing DNA-binding protein [Hymenobacter sp. M29]
MQFNIPAEHKNASGVYVIRNTTNRRVYVGSTVNLRRRFNGHRAALISNTHHNGPLQRYFNKYGAGGLSFNLLELVALDANELAKVEQHYITLFNAAHRKTGFNIDPQVYPSPKLSESTKKKLARKRGPLSEQHKLKLSEYAKGRTPPTKGKKLSAEHRAKIGIGQLGRASPMKGRKASEETRQKLSLARTGKKQSPETIAKRNASRQRYFENRQAKPAPS